MFVFNRLCLGAWLGFAGLLPLAGRAQELAEWPARAVPHTLLDSIRYLQTRGIREAVSDPPAGRRTDEDAVRLALRLGNPQVLSLCWRQLGDRYYDALSMNSQPCYENALTAARQAHWMSGIGDAYIGMGHLAYDRSDFRRALRCYRQAAHYYAQVPRTAANRASQVRNELLMLANALNAHYELHQPDSAMRLCRQAWALHTHTLATAPDGAWRAAFRHRNGTVMANILCVQGDLYQEWHQPDSARRCAEQGLRLQTDPETEASLRTDLAELELARHRPQAAHDQLRVALQLARSGGFVAMLNDALRLQPRVLWALHRPEAFDSLQAYVVFQDSLTARNRLEAAAQAQARFDSREQQAQIRSLQQQRRLATQNQRLARQLARQQLAGLAGLAALLLAGAGALFARYRRRQAATRAAAAATLRQRLAADLHDDVGNLLTQISMQSSLLRENTHSPAQLLARLDHLTTTARQATQQMSDVVWGLNQTSQSLPELLDRMRDHAHEVCFPLGIEVDFEASPAATAVSLAPEALQTLYLIYKEALHNVVKHAQATRVTVRLTLSSAGLRLLAADNGQGHDGTLRPDGNGLRNMQARAQAVGGTVRYEALAPGFGVVVQLPVTPA